MNSRNVPALLSLFAVIGLATTGCQKQPLSTNANPASNTQTQGQATPVSVQLNWHAEAEHGGLYQAFADGTYTKSRLVVEIKPGGTVTPIASELESGRSQFAISNADDVVLARQEGVDLVAVMAVMQNHPRCILVRADSDIESFEDLAGKTFQCGNRPYVEFLRSKGLLNDVQVVPYQNSVAGLVSDPNIVMQGYSFAEPLLAKQQGVEVRLLMLSDLGWNPYSSVLVTTGKMIREQPDLVRTFVQATREGWRHYVQDAALGNELILGANRYGMTAEALDYGSRELRSLAVPPGMKLEQLGEMTPERWQTLVTQMTQLGLADAEKVSASECFTTEFL